MYVNCKTYFSLRYGTFATDELVKAAVEQGVHTLALTNINTTCDAWEFVKCCLAEKIKPVVGVEIRNGEKFLYILLAKNNSGFAAINSFLSYHLTRDELFPEFPSSVIHDCYIIYALGAKAFEALFADEFIGVQYTVLNKLYGIDKNLVEKKCVVRQPVTFQRKGYFNLHKLLRAIDNNVLLSKLSPESVCAPHEYLIPPEKLLQHFSKYSQVGDEHVPLAGILLINGNFSNN